MTPSSRINNPIRSMYYLSAFGGVWLEGGGHTLNRLVPHMMTPATIPKTVIEILCVAAKYVNPR
jgi:hypothetical protein